MSERRCGPLKAAVCGFVLGLIAARLCERCRAGRGCCCGGDDCCRDAGDDEGGGCCCDDISETAADEEGEASAE